MLVIYERLELVKAIEKCGMRAHFIDLPEAEKRTTSLERID